MAFGIDQHGLERHATERMGGAGQAGVEGADRHLDVIQQPLGELPAGHPPLPGGGHETQALPGGHPPLPPIGSAAGQTMAHTRTHAGGGVVVEPGSIAKPAGGVTVAEILAEKAGLAGKEVIVRGRVVKYTGGILKRNWLHIKDGTGAAGADDLTVTTTGQAAVGDTVVVKGTVAADKDFGAGYRYAVLIEDATVTVEQTAEK